MPTATVRVSDLPSKATKQDVMNFFSFSGEIQRIDFVRDGDASQIAYVVFRDYEALDTALLLSGAKILNQYITIVPVEGYTPSPEVDEHLEGRSGTEKDGTEEKAKAVIAEVLAKGYLLGKDAVNMAKSFDQKHQLSAQASATISSFDKRVGLSDKVNIGTSTLNQGVKAVDEKLQVVEATKSALTAAEQTLQTAGSALMKNKYIFTGATWVTGAFNRVVKVANDVSQKAKEKIQVHEMEKRDGFGMGTHHDLFAEHLDDDDFPRHYQIPDGPAPLKMEAHY